MVVICRDKIIGILDKGNYALWGGTEALTKWGLAIPPNWEKKQMIEPPQFKRYCTRFVVWSELKEPPASNPNDNVLRPPSKAIYG